MYDLGSTVDAAGLLCSLLNTLLTLLICFVLCLPTVLSSRLLKFFGSSSRGHTLESSLSRRCILLDCLPYGNISSQWLLWSSSSVMCVDVHRRAQPMQLFRPRTCGCDAHKSSLDLWYHEQYGKTCRGLYVYQ